MINKILDVLIAIIYAICNTVGTCQLADANVIQKSVSFCEIMLVNVQHFGNVGWQTSVVCACKIDSLLDIYESNDL